MTATNLSKLGITLSPLALGCEPLGGADWGKVDMVNLHAAVEQAWDMGIRVFDTADIYGLGHSEEQLAKALGGKRQEAVIVSKFGCRWITQKNQKRAVVYKDSSPEYLEKALEASLNRLKIDAIPIYLVHWPDAQTPLEATLEKLERCREAGKIIAYGLSNFKWTHYKSLADKYPLAAIQGPYSLITQEPGKAEYSCARHAGLATLTYGPLAQGFLSGKYDQNSNFEENDRRHRLKHFSNESWHCNKRLIRVLHQASEAHQKTPAQVALRWIIEQNIVNSVIVGATNPDQVKNNMGALGWQLGSHWMQKLTAAGQTRKQQINHRKNLD